MPLWGYLVDSLVGAQGGPRGLAIAGQDVDHAGRDACLIAQSSHPQCGQRGLFRNLNKPNQALSAMCMIDRGWEFSPQVLLPFALHLPEVCMRDMDPLEPAPRLT